MKLSQMNKEKAIKNFLKILEFELEFEFKKLFLFLDY